MNPLKLASSNFGRSHPAQGYDAPKNAQFSQSCVVTLQVTFANVGDVERHGSGSVCTCHRSSLGPWA